jgi:hypothetical protein
MLITSPKKIINKRERDKCRNDAKYASRHLPCAVHHPRVSCGLGHSGLSKATHAQRARRAGVRTHFQDHSTMGAFLHQDICEYPVV